MTHCLLQCQLDFCFLFAQQVRAWRGFAPCTEVPRASRFASTTSCRQAQAQASSRIFALDKFFVALIRRCFGLAPLVALLVVVSSRGRISTQQATPRRRFVGKAVVPLLLLLLLSINDDAGRRKSADRVGIVVVTRCRLS